MDTKKLRQKILDLAIHGKLVPQDPNDEPASMLLERIRAEKERLIAEGKIKRSRKAVKTSDTHHYENVPFEVPQGWELIALEEIFILNPKNEVDDETLAGFIPMALVDDGFCGSHSFEQELWKNIKKGFSHFQNGDIGIAKISPCFENMKSVIFNNLPNGLGAGTTELTILRGILIDVKFYLYLFKTSWYISQGTKYFKGVVGQQRVNKAIFTTLEVPLPPLAEQQRIVSEIERWSVLIDTQLSRARKIWKHQSNKPRAKSLTLPFMVNSYRKIPRMSRRLNYSSTSILRLKSLVITSIVGSCIPKDGYSAY
nr:restriction endonuclease subunit S [uncultured Prevotella sp.]